MDDDSIEAMFTNEKELTQVLKRLKSEMGVPVLSKKKYVSENSESE